MDEEARQQRAGTHGEHPQRQTEGEGGRQFDGRMADVHQRRRERLRGDGQQHAAGAGAAPRHQREQQRAAERQLPRHVVEAEVRQRVRGHADRRPGQLQRVGPRVRVEDGELRIPQGEDADERRDRACDQHGDGADTLGPADADLAQAAATGAQGDRRRHAQQRGGGGEAHGIVQERSRFGARQQPGQRRGAGRRHREREQRQPDGSGHDHARQIGPHRPAGHRFPAIAAITAPAT